MLIQMLIRDAFNNLEKIRVYREIFASIKFFLNKVIPKLY